MNNSARCADLVSSRKSKTSKRNLSSSSLSPSVTDKKSKIFISPNCFAALAVNDSIDQVDAATSASNSIVYPPANKPHTNPVRDPPIPPIFVKNIVNFSAFKTTLINITSPNIFTCRAFSSYLKIQPLSRLDYNSILDYLHQTDASFHTYTPRHLRTYRCVIRNLHHSTLVPDIINALADLGHNVKYVHNAKNKDRVPLPLFFVEILPQDNNNGILSISSLLNTKVSIEKPHSKKIDPPQCFQCQAYGHTKNNCHHNPRCVKCGEDHFTEDCTKDRSSPAKCALCSKDHTANFKGCPVFKAAFKKAYPRVTSVKTPTSNIHQASYKSYAEVTRNQISQPDHIGEILSSFITSLNSLISPLISLLSSVLNSLIAKDIISP